MCGKGCLEKWDIPVDPRSEKAVRGSAIELRVIQENGGPPFDIYQHTADGKIMARHPDNRCVCLGDDSLCKIHGAMGWEAKPVPCSQFPFTAVGTPDGLFVGATFFCTSVQQNTGRPLAEHEPFVREISKFIHYQRLGYRPFKLADGATLDWEVYKVLEARLGETIASAGPLKATSRAFRVLSEGSALVGEGGLTLEIFNRLWESASRSDLGADMMLGMQLEFFLGALLGVVEVGADIEHRAICESFIENKKYHLPRLQADVDFALAASHRSYVEQHFAGQIHRYLHSLLHRKFLCANRPVIDNVLFLYLMVRLLTVYTSLYAQRRSPGLPPQESDYFKALDILEADVATHSRGLEKLISTYSVAVHQYLVAASGAM